MAVALDPTNAHATGALQELGPGRALWLALPAIGAIGVMAVAAFLFQRRRKRRQAGRMLKA